MITTTKTTITTTTTTTIYRRSQPKRLNWPHCVDAIKGGGSHLNTMECLATAKSHPFGTN